MAFFHDNKFSKGRFNLFSLQQFHIDMVSRSVAHSHPHFKEDEVVDYSRVAIREAFSQACVEVAVRDAQKALDVIYVSAGIVIGAGVCNFLSEDPVGLTHAGYAVAGMVMACMGAWAKQSTDVALLPAQQMSGGELNPQALGQAKAYAHARERLYREYSLALG